MVQHMWNEKHGSVGRIIQYRKSDDSFLIDFGCNGGKVWLKRGTFDILG